MKGSNVLTVNEATLIAAMQMYLDSQFKEGTSPEVLNVQKATGGGYTTQGMFEVSLMERTPKEKP